MTENLDSVKCENKQLKLTKKEQFELARELCRIIDAAPEYIFENKQMVSNHEFHIDSLKLERFLIHRGHSIRIHENINDAILRIYGEKALTLINTLA